jgi:tetratricopeptide (TPR) repeat protein
VSSFSRMTIVSVRKDGVGGRLVSMINAGVIAERVGSRFGFIWNRQASVDKTFHVVDTVDKIFSADFIERCWLGETVPKSEFLPLPLIEFSRRDLRKAARGKDIRGWICNELTVLKRFRDTWTFRDFFGLRGPVNTAKVFQKFGFAPDVEAAFAAAQKPAMVRPVAAIHLRSGDIVYGKFRRFRFTTKAIPSALVKALVARLNALGMDTLLIGQDRATLEYLKAETSAFLTDDFGASDFGDPTMREFFEIALMARCHRIYSGSSFFAALASAIRGKPVDKISRLILGSEAAEFVLQELSAHGADYHPLDAAFGYQWVFRALERSLTRPQAEEILNNARNLDPENEAYALKLAALDFRDGLPDMGEQLLASLMESDWLATSKMPTQSMQTFASMTSSGPFIGRELDFVEQAADRGYPHAAAYCANLHFARGAPEKARRLVDLALELDPSSEAFAKLKYSFSGQKKIKKRK